MSPMPDLKTVYGGNGKMATNRAIRAECPGGAELLDTLRTWQTLCNKLGWSPRNRDGSEALHVTAYTHLLTIADAMEDAIYERYKIPQRARAGKRDLER